MRSITILALILLIVFASAHSEEHGAGSNEHSEHNDHNDHHGSNKPVLSIGSGIRLVI